MPSRPSPGLTTPSLPLLLAAALAGGALLYGLDGYPLLEPDEGRNAEVAREMAASNDYVLPRLNGLPYLDKPVVFFAAGALAMEILGPTELAARLPSLVFTLLTVALVARLGRRWYGRDGAWVAGIAYVASPFTLAYARTVIMDSAVTLWMTLAIGALVEATERRDGGTAVGGQQGGAIARDGEARGTAGRRGERGGGPASRWALAGWTAIGLGVLTKGPVALVVPLLVVVPYAAWRRRLASVLDPVGLLVFLAVVLPWVFAVSRHVPDFLRYVLVVETAQRLSTGVLGRSEAWWYFFPIVLGAALPWSVLALAGLRRPARHDATDPRAVLLVLWIALPLLFFTLSQSKRPQYVLPLMPAFALGVAHLWHRDPGRLPGARAAGLALAAVGAALMLAAARVPDLVPASPDVAALIPRTARWLGGIAVLSGATAFALPGRRAWTMLALAAPVCAIPVIGLPLLAAIGRDRSSADLAAAMRPWVGETTEIVAIRTYPLSLPFYLRRTLTLVTADGRELTSNYLPRRMDLLRAAPGSPLRPPRWWEEALALCDRPRLFVTRADAPEVRERLRGTLPLVAASRTVAVYGPCGAGSFADLRSGPRGAVSRDRSLPPRDEPPLAGPPLPTPHSPLAGS